MEPRKKMMIALRVGTHARVEVRNIVISRDLILILFSGNRQIPGLATGAVGHSLFYSRR